MKLGFSALAVIAGVSLHLSSVHGAENTSAAFSDYPVSVVHVVAHTKKPYEAVKASLEAKLGRLDEQVRKYLAENDIERLRAALQERRGSYGLVIHYVGVHGDWLALDGGRKNGIVYHIGNVLSAVQMTRKNFGAGLYAPLRLAIYEEEGGTALEFDKPSSQFAQFHDSDIDQVAASLDERIYRLVTDISK